MAPQQDSFGDRMKGYELVSHYHLTRRLPLIVRVDGRAFHTLTRGMRKPFDPRISAAMDHAALEVAKEMQGFVMGYVQSDEASFYLQDDALLDTQPWFGKDLSKILSITAALMSVHFNEHMWKWAPYLGEAYLLPRPGAIFDARAFTLPDAEVANYFLWRAKDWERNSLSMLAQAHFSPKQLHGKGRADMHEMLHGIGVNWTTDVDERHRNGCFITRDVRQMEVSMIGQPTHLLDWTSLLTHTAVPPNYNAMFSLLASVRPTPQTTDRQTQTQGI